SSRPRLILEVTAAEVKALDGEGKIEHGVGYGETNLDPQTSTGPGQNPVGLLHAKFILTDYTFGHFHHTSGCTLPGGSK
ncbi:unnamed protein product, partial [Allacma fusca]